MSRIIVKNLPCGMKEERLRRLFDEYGQITECSLKYTKGGVFRKFAFVGFHSESDAHAAVSRRNNTYIDTAKIQVTVANSLLDSSKSRPWSKHSKKPSSQQPSDAAANIDSTAKPESKNEKKKPFENELLKELENNVDFHEFLEVHKSKSRKSAWANDIVLPASEERRRQKVKTSDKSHSSDVDDEAATENAGTREVKEKKKLSDLEYLKSKMTGNMGLSDAESDSEAAADDDDDDKDKKDAAESQRQEKPTRQYLVKMKGLPSKVTESQIQEFFKPIVPTQVQIPKKNRKSSGVVTVEFSSEKDQEMALRRNKNYVGSKKVFLHKLNALLKETKNEEKHCAWQLKERDLDVSSVAETGLLFVRNLAYCCTEQDLQSLFEKYGSPEVNLPVDRFTKKIKGFAHIKFDPPENAVKALADLDGSVFQGRMLHVIPGKSQTHDSEITDNLPFKKKKELQQKVNASSAYSWNTLFVGANAVADTMAQKYSRSKDEILTQSGKKDSIGVRVALGETQIVTEIRQFLLDSGVVLDSFSNPSGERSKTVFLIKHLPAGTTADELRQLFERHGTISRLLLPPRGLTAIIEYTDATEARTAFRSLAYTKFKHVPLYLEWAPVDVFQCPATEPLNSEQQGRSHSDKKTNDDVDDGGDNVEEEDEPVEAGCTLFVKNLNFATTEDALKQVFRKVGKIRAVTVARKKDVHHSGQLLSMGYGFVEYKKLSAAKEALKVLQHTMLDGHQLELKLSNRTTLQSESQRQRRAAAKKLQKNTTKILIRNIPFEAKVSELRQLFGVFGELKSLRMPKKQSGTGTHRGFGFADFLTKEDAKRAFEALCHSTHLYGRRLVLEWADPESDTLDELRRKTARHYIEDSHAGKRLKKSAILGELDGTEDGL